MIMIISSFCSIVYYRLNPGRPLRYFEQQVVYLTYEEYFEAEANSFSFHVFMSIQDFVGTGSAAMPTLRNIYLR